MEFKEEVKRGIIFIKCSGVLNSDSMMVINNELDYLLYNQGLTYYAFDFSNLIINSNVVGSFQNKLVEIFLRCGKVVLCGLSKFYREMIGDNRDLLYYVDNEDDVFDFLSL